MDKRALIICMVADQAAAQAIADATGGGAAFGPSARRLSTNPAATTDNPTHLCVSGSQPEEFVEAMRSSSVPIFMVIDNPDDMPVQPILAALEPPLYFCIENEVV